MNIAAPSPLKNSYLIEAFNLLNRISEMLL